MNFKSLAVLFLEKGITIGRDCSLVVRSVRWANSKFHIVSSIRTPNGELHAIGWKTKDDIYFGPYFASINNAADWELVKE